jgi:hypothetical protein
MAKAKVMYADGRYPYPAAGAHKPGDVVLRPDGTYAIFDGLEGCASGERIQPQPLKAGPTILFEKNSASDNLAASATVYLIPASGKITATPTNNVVAGKLVQAAGTGITHAHVNPLAIDTVQIIVEEE